MSDCKHRFSGSTTCVYCGVSFNSLQQQMIAGLSDEISKLRAQLAGSEQSAAELERRGRIAGLTEAQGSLTFLGFDTAASSLNDYVKSVKEQEGGK